MRLHYLVKLKIRVFQKILMKAKVKLKKFYLLTLILLIENMQLFDVDIMLSQI